MSKTSTKVTVGRSKKIIQNFYLLKLFLSHDIFHVSDFHTGQISWIIKCSFSGCYVVLVFLSYYFRRNESYTYHTYHTNRRLLHDQISICVCISLGIWHLKLVEPITYYYSKISTNRTTLTWAKYLWPFTLPTQPISIKIMNVNEIYVEIL